MEYHYLHFPTQQMTCHRHYLEDEYNLQYCFPLLLKEEGFSFGVWGGSWREATLKAYEWKEANKVIGLGEWWVVSFIKFGDYYVLYLIFMTMTTLTSDTTLQTKYYVLPPYFKKYTL